MNKSTKIYIAGHKGLVGSAIVKDLQSKGYHNLIFRTHHELDLINQQAVADFFVTEKPEYVFLAAGKVGGIAANNMYRADFIYQNLSIQNNIIHQSYLNKVHKLLFLGSTCVYPKNAPQPMLENSLLTSPLEYTNEPYAIAKIAGIKMCESYNLQYGTNFISVMPTNLYGANDNFDLETSHVLPALLRKMHLAKCLEQNNWQAIRKDLHKIPITGISANSPQEEILAILLKYGISSTLTICGSGKARREFLYSKDMADACVYLMEKVNFQDLNHSTLNAEVRNTHINIGTGVDISIKELAQTIKKIVGYQGQLTFNTDKPDGTMIKLTNPSKLKQLGWNYKMELEPGIKAMYKWYSQHVLSNNIAK